MQELWAPVVGYEGLYEVSDLGRVRSLDHFKSGRQFKGRKLKPAPNSGGYLTVGLCKNGSKLSKTVHCLVAAAFLGPRPEGLQVRHGLRGKLDNSLANLCYGTPKQNEEDRIRDGTNPVGIRNPYAKLTEANVYEIRSLLAAGKSQISIANTFGVSQSGICLIKLGKTWAHLA